MKIRLIFALFILTLVSACASLKPVIRTIDDVAQFLCEKKFKKSPPAGAPTDGASLEDAAKHYCSVQEHLRPWIDEVLRLENDGVRVTETTEVVVTKDEGAAGASAQ